jgi:hypothetical protein
MDVCNQLDVPRISTTTPPYNGWMYQEKTPLPPPRMKAVRSDQDRPLLIFTFTLEYENEIEIWKARNKNEHERDITIHRKRTNSSENMLITIGMWKENREHRPIVHND